jgi:Na+-transporting methylmalonyl-CoA/oxaloacetate decarboxylase beta subunit
MTKSELKTGMWVEYSDGKRACVMLDSIKGDVITDGHTWIFLSQIMDDLSDDYGSCHVVKVYSPMSFVDMISGESMKLIWEREPEPIEMTLEEACKKLRETVGKPVKITL